MGQVVALEEELADGELRERDVLGWTTDTEIAPRDLPASK